MRLLGSFGLLTLLCTATALYADDGLGTSPSPSSAETLARASDLMQRADTAYKRVTLFQGQVRAQRDVIKLNCVNSKLIQLKAQLNIADNENLTLQVAVADHKDIPASLQNLKTTIDSVDRLYQEAKLCVGANELGTHGTSSNHPAFLDQPTPIEMPFDGTFSSPIEPPAYASPIM